MKSSNCTGTNTWTSMAFVYFQLWLQVAHLLFRTKLFNLKDDHRTHYSTTAHEQVRQFEIQINNIFLIYAKPHKGMTCNTYWLLLKNGIAYIKDNVRISCIWNFCVRNCPPLSVCQPYDQWHHHKDDDAHPIHNMNPTCCHNVYKGFHCENLPQQQTGIVTNTSTRGEGCVDLGVNTNNKHF